MKTKKFFQRSLQVAFLTLLVAGMTSCFKDSAYLQTDDENETNGEFAGFNFGTTTEYKINIALLSNDNEPLSGIKIEIFTQNPLDSRGVRKNEDSSRVFAGASGKDGVLNTFLTLPSYSDSLYVLVNYVGLQGYHPLALSNTSIDLVIGGKKTMSETGPVIASARSFKGLQPTTVNGYYVLGAWDKQGVPYYLEEPDDIISSELLADINATLPETKHLPESHPQYFVNSNDANHNIIDKCNIWVTFVHEGAGWTNSLGYYTYPTNTPPASVADIKEKTIIIPNVSMLNSNGGLSSGNKVQLLYLDPATGQFSDVFPAGITVGWFLIAGGWNSSQATLQNGYYTHYSNDILNSETDQTIRKHSVLLYDDIRKLFLLGFEDIRRDKSSDEDFNDAVFYSTVNPITAVDLGDYKPVDRPGDTDNDGISDVFDEYPEDNNKAFNNYYPEKAAQGSIVFEDMWPNKGDYDFNDLVVGYNINQITNASNEVVEIKSKITVRAIGASYRNGFAISLNTTPGNIVSVTGQRNYKNYLSISSNGTENGQSLAVIPVFDDAYNVLPYSGSGIGVNTVPGTPYVHPDTLNLNITFKNPLTLKTLGAPPYNPFLIANKERGHEVHLPSFIPTDLADRSLFGTEQDNSNPALSKYYVCDDDLPWAINLPAEFSYPAEKVHIMKAHIFFDTWAKSHGYSFMDWYINKNGYRDQTKLY